MRLLRIPPLFQPFSPYALSFPRLLHLPPFPNFTLPTPQTFTSSSTLPYPAAPLFQLIADISAYASFVPYVTGARITAWSEADARYRRRWPRRAELRVGWEGIVDERFESRVYCVPDRVVEAVSGSARCGIPKGDLGHYYCGKEGDRQGNEGDEGGVFESMRTRWELEELESGMGTHVRLDVDVCFANQVYAALSQAAGPKVAEIMVEAFESRVREILGEGDVGSKEKAQG